MKNNFIKTLNSKSIVIKSVFILLIFALSTFYSCSFLFGYQIEGTKWMGNLLFVNMVLEFEPNGIVKTAGIELVYNTVSKNQGTYTFDKQSLTGSITIDGEVGTFSINEKTNTLTLSSAGISVNFQNVTDTFTWPSFNLTGKTYKGDWYDSSYNLYHWSFSFTGSSTGTLIITDSNNINAGSGSFTYTWDTTTYTGVMNLNSHIYDFQVSIDQKYMIFNYLSDEPIYCELQN